MKNSMKKMLILVSLFICVMPGTAFSLDAYITHVTAGFSMYDDYLLVDNHNLTAKNFTLTLYGGNTQVYQGGFSVNGLSELVLELKSLAATAETGVIVYDDPLLNFRIGYDITDSGGVAEFQLTDSRNPILCFHFSDYTAGLSWKGMGLGNLNATAATVKLYAIGGGQVLESADVTIPAYGKEVNVYTRWFPNLAFADIKKIIAVSTANLCGFSISGNATNSLLLFTPAVELAEFETGLIPSSDITGTWRGMWRSTDSPGFSGNITMTITQSGDTYTGTVDVTDTDCGDVRGISVSGNISGNNLSVLASFNCQGDIATLESTNVTVVGTVMAGTYQQNVNGVFYDAGTLNLTKE